MGKKSRIKKQRRDIEKIDSSQTEKEIDNEKAKGFELFLLWVVRLGTAAALFTPLVIGSRYYFPFVGPKGLYLLGACQVVFFAWLILAVRYKKYRPRMNHVLIVFACFLFFFIISSVFGIDFSRSFWSKFERMTGLLVWLHLFGWFLAISSSFRKLSDWKRILWVSVGISGLISFIALLAEVSVVVYERGGSSLGNTSFLGTYLLFNVFFALYLFFKEKNKYLKSAALIIAIASAFSIYLAGARAATLGTIGGIGLIGLLFLSFKVKSRGVRIAGKIALTISSLVIFLLVILLFVPNSPVSNKFIELTTASRAVNWQMAWKGFLEKPLFGWGPENYTVFFTKFFDPCLFIPTKCGGEIWFDRTHNVVLDALITTGIFGLLSYLGLFAVMGYVLIKKHFKEKTISFWLFAVFLSLFAAYFIQNLTVFDMPATLMLFALVLGFIAFLSGVKTSHSVEEKPRRAWPSVILLLVFVVAFFEFVIQPAKTDYFVIKSAIVGSSEERLEYYKKTFDASPMGKYQIRDFFAQQTQDIVRQNLDKVPKEVLARELDFVIKEMQKTVKEVPIDYRATLKLAQIHNIYALIDTSKLELAEKYGRDAVALSPNNQQAYWSLAQTKIYQKEYDEGIAFAKKAVELEPEWINSHKILVEVALRAEQYDRAEQFAREAINFNPEWREEFDNILAGTPGEAAE